MKLTIRCWRWRLARLVSGQRSFANGLVARHCARCGCLDSRCGMLISAYAVGVMVGAPLMTLYFLIVPAAVR